MINLFNKSYCVALIVFVIVFSSNTFSNDEAYMDMCLAELEKYINVGVFNLSGTEKINQKEGSLIRVTFDKANSHNASFSMCEFYEKYLFNMEFIFNGVESRFTFDTLIYEKFYDEESYGISSKPSYTVKYMKHLNKWSLSH